MSEEDKTIKMTLEVSSAMSKAIKDRAKLLNQTDAGLVRAILTEALKDEIKEIAKARKN